MSDNWVIYFLPCCNGMRWIAEKHGVKIVGPIKRDRSESIINWNRFSDKTDIVATII